MTRALSRLIVAMPDMAQDGLVIVGKEKKKSGGREGEDDAAAEIDNGKIGLRVKEVHLLYTREPGNGPK
jgi:hypothetical protein